MNRTIWKHTPPAVKWLLTVTFLMNAGFYALIPYLTLHLTGSFGWSLALAGLLLAIRQFAQQGLSFLGGIAADRFGCKGAMVLGTTIRATGFASFAWCSDIWEFFAAGVLSGLGGALFEPAGSAAYGILTPPEIRRQVFAFRNVLTNIGIVGSQVVGTVLAAVDFDWLSLFAGGVFYLCALLSFWFIPAMEGTRQKERWWESAAHVLRDRLFLRYTALLIGFYYLYMQLFLAVPQFAQDVLGGTWAVGVVLTTVSLSVVLFQMPVTRWLERYQRPFSLIGAGTFLMGAGLWLFALSDTLWLVVLDAMVFALGTTVAVPHLVDIVPRFAPPDRLGAYYGFNAYALAIGGSVSTILGGWLYDAGKAWQMEWLPWMFCLAAGAWVGWNLHRMEGCLEDARGAELRG